METVDVLLVEDNPGDVVMLKEALLQAGIPYRVHCASDGAVAMDFLKRRSGFAAAPTPGLIILDLNVPRKDGRSVLAEVMSDDGLRRIPVVILTSSTVDRDILEQFGLPAECYLVKPMLFGDYLEVVRTIDAFRRNIADGSPTSGASAAE